MPGKKPILRFWGVRGSIPTPGPSTVRYGGNTACVELVAGDDRIVFDAGSGLRELGLELAKKSNLHLTILLSHYHWDHLLGLPFFGPIFKPDTRLDIYGEVKNGVGPRQALERKFAGPMFPVELGALPSRIEYHAAKPGDHFNVGEIAVSIGRLNHPNAAICYKATMGKKVVVYASDHEHDGQGDRGLIDFCAGADVLVYDAMYSDESYAQGKKGWGHSTWQEGVRVAQAAKVKNLFLYHHDPAHDDKKLAAIGREAKKRFENTFVACEGETFDL